MGGQLVLSPLRPNEANGMVEATTDQEEIHPLFPVCITKHRLNRALTDEELSVLLSRDRFRVIGNMASVDGYVLDDPTLASLRAFLLQCLHRHFDRIYDPATNVGPHITQSWMTYSSRGQSHPKHFHFNSFISGVFYVQTSPGDNITFHSPRKEMFRITPNAFTFTNSDSCKFDAVTGEVFLFPSYLEHHVDPHQDDSLRVSLSFNTFLHGRLGDDRGKTQLDLGDWPAN
jgi:uncharacterized protein (TIGR02466 family)